MKKIIGVRFKPAGKVYDFDCGVFVLKRGDHVIVETEKGLGLGMVAVPSVSIGKKVSDKPLKKVFRLASKEDFIQKEKNVGSEKHAYAFCQKCITDLGLKMNLFAVESAFDASQLTFFFTSDGRIDFRHLVKMLVKRFRVRIEMKQVGIRNQAKICGGIGRCGRMICCSSFMEKFDPVSIRLAKEQGMSLNPTKISGQCGRLMCCLTFEHETYQELRKKFPKIGKTVKTAGGKGCVIRHNVICGRITVRLDDGSEMETELDKIISEKK